MEPVIASSSDRAVIDRSPNRDGDVRLTSGSRKSNSIWLLSGQVADGETVRHVPIHTSPFRVGRRSDMALCLPCRTVSGFHAEILDSGEHLLLRDVGSTNGTYVNGQRIHGQCVIHSDDLIQFADLPFRARRQFADTSCQTVHEDLCDHALALVQFDQLMSSRAVIPFYQPIVDLDTKLTMGYEVLGRSEVFGLEMPAAMFRAAAQLDLEVDLSRMFRWEGVRATVMRDDPPHLFVNTHPSELVKPGLLESMRALREMSPTQRITLEIHEASVTNVMAMNELRSALADLKMGLAYDDFGAGQNRLMELVEVRPDYLKFDMGLIRHIHLAPEKRQMMLQTLVRMVCDLGVVPLAEGIECEDEGVVCRQLGFTLAQGYYYGRPAPVTNLSNT